MNFKTSKQAEENYLKKTLEVVKSNVENYGREVGRMQEDIDEMLAHYHDNDVEVYTILSNTVTMHDHMKWALIRNEKALKKPYFGRIIFHDKALDKEESLYIGKGGISADATHQVVVDWRAPVANAYYENSLGECSYAAPGGEEMEIDLKLKRTYEIEDGQLQDYFDSEVVANDELLTKYLAKNKQAVLNEIVATIQKEQNEIIRKSPYHNIIVQGVAGSGKTTVAMHRISFILYNYAERFRPDDFYIVGSNRILLDYITSVLPDLDVHGIRQMTMEQLFVRLLYEDWDEQKYSIKGTDPGNPKGSIKGRSQWFRDLEEYCRKIEREAISTESVYLNPRQFVEGFRNGKTGVFDETAGETINPKSLVCLVDGTVVEDYLRENPSISVQNKIDMLNQRLTSKIKDEFLGKGIKYTEAERKAILKAYRGRYGGREWKRSIYEMYQEFLMKQAIKGYEVEIPDKAFDVYDLAALAYLYKRIKEKEVISEAHHIVIDEAQDFGMMAYHVLKFCIYGCTYTVMGDVSQNIHFGFGLNDWEELKKLLLPDPMDSFGLLKKSYRNTVEISNFAMDILHHGKFSVYPAEPIIRHGDPVMVKQILGRKELIREAAEICQSWQQKGLDTIAVICRDKQSAEAATKELSEYVELMESNLEKAVFGSGIMVLPVEYTKGLEFDAVLILDPTREEYPTEDGHAKLLYVAATRALHELCVLHSGNLTGLIEDPIPQRAVPTEPKEEILSGESAGTKQGGKAPSKASILAGKVTDEARKQDQEEKRSSDEPGRNKRPVAISRKAASFSIATPEDKKPYIARKIGKASDDFREETDKSEDLHLEQPAYKDKKNVQEKKSGNEVLFGDMPVNEKLRPAGHSKIDLAVRWAEKRPDGLYLQSRYGTLRLCPVSSRIIRVTFAKGGSIAQGTHSKITADKEDKAWMYKSIGNVVELLTDELCLQVDKGTGAIRYMTRDKKLLLAERSRECRQIESSPKGKMRTWTFFEWQKGENLYAVSQRESGMKLRGTARYISQAEGLPFVFSDKGYGILVATDSPVICCDIPAYGSYLYAENEIQIDFYFLAGKNQREILSEYESLCSWFTCSI